MRELVDEVLEYARRRRSKRQYRDRIKKLYADAKRHGVLGKSE